MVQVEADEPTEAEVVVNLQGVEAEVGRDNAKGV